MTTTIVEGTKDFPKVVKVDGTPGRICCPNAGDTRPWCGEYLPQDTKRCKDCPVKVLIPNQVIPCEICAHASENDINISCARCLLNTVAGEVYFAIDFKKVRRLE